MSTISTVNQPSKAAVDWSSLVQLTLSAMAAVLLLGLATLMVVSGGVQYLSQAISSAELTQSFMVAASLVFAGVLVIPSAWYAWKDLASPQAVYEPRQEQRDYTLILTLLVLVLVSGALVLGSWISQNEQLAWFFLPLLNIVATGLPALWLVYVGTHGLISGSPKRKWGTFASGLLLSPAIILVLELFILIGLAILILLWIMLDPNNSSQLSTMLFRLQNTSPNPDEIFELLSPLLIHPGVMFLAFAFISVIVPLIEEALKPLGVWFQAGQKITPAQGFAYGVLCGAGFGLFENLGNTSAANEIWVVLASTRISTLLLHSLTTGLVGWALASAWSEKRYLRLGFTFTFAVLVHGLWNGMAAISAVSSLESQVDLNLPDYLPQLGNLATIGIVALGAFILVLFVSFSNYLRKSVKTRLPLRSGDEISHVFPTTETIAGHEEGSTSSTNASDHPELAGTTPAIIGQPTYAPEDNHSPTPDENS